MFVSWGLDDAGLIRGTSLAAATPAAATVAAEQISPMTATATAQPQEAHADKHRNILPSKECASPSHQQLHVNRQSDRAAGGIRAT